MIMKSCCLHFQFQRISLGHRVCQYDTYVSIYVCNAPLVLRRYIEIIAYVCTYVHTYAMHLQSFFTKTQLLHKVCSLIRRSYLFRQDPVVHTSTRELRASGCSRPAYLDRKFYDLQTAAAEPTERAHTSLDQPSNYLLQKVLKTRKKKNTIKQ